MSVSRGVVLCFAKFKGLCPSVCKGHKTFGSGDETDAQDTGQWTLDTGNWTQDTGVTLIFLREPS